MSLLDVLDDGHLHDVGVLHDVGRLHVVLHGDRRVKFSVVDGKFTLIDFVGCEFLPESSRVPKIDFCGCGFRGVSKTCSVSDSCCEICGGDETVLKAGGCEGCISDVCLGCRLAGCGWIDFEADGSKVYPCLNCFTNGFNCASGNNNGRCLNCCVMPILGGCAPIGVNAETVVNDDDKACVADVLVWLGKAFNGFVVDE